MTGPRAAGYSTTPLVRKLGIRAGDRILLLDAPPEYRSWLAPLPDGVAFARAAGPTVDVAHVFVTGDEVLAARLAQLRRALAPEAVVWVSWPKKASKLPTTVSEDIIRRVALPLGFVDVKVCAVSEVWSGLKLVVRKALR